MRRLDQDVQEPSFDDVLWTLLFVTSVWIGGKVAARLGMPGLVGEIAVGITMGPHGADLVPAPEALMLYGEVGLMLLVLEAGLDVDLDMLKLIGLRGVGVAISGSLAPLSLGAAIAYFVFGQGWKASLAVGCTLAPTSMGIALNVLKAGGVLNTPTGQLVIAAAVLDDVIALILLAELRALENPTLLKLVLPIVSSVGLMVGVGWLGVFVTPMVTRAIMPRIQPKSKKKFFLGMLLFLAILLVPCCHQLGSSHLLGAFLAGLCFCTDHEAHSAWQEQVKRVLQWLLKIFFAATIGFEVPVRSFAQPAVIWRAALLCTASIGKVATGVWAVPLRTSEFFTVGFAMAAWGEFAFITATTARDAHIIDDTIFSATILAVLVSVVIAPTLLRITLARSSRAAYGRIDGAMRRVPPPPPSASERRSERGVKLAAAEQSVELGSPCAAPTACYRLRTRSPPVWGLNSVLTQLLMEQGLVVLDSRSQHGHNPPMVVTEIFLQDLLLCLPPTATLRSKQEKELKRRLKTLTTLVTQALTDSAQERQSVKVDLIRWMGDANSTANGRAVGREADRATGNKVAGQCLGGRAAGSGGAAGLLLRTAAAARAPAVSQAEWEHDEDREYEHHGYSYKSFANEATLGGSSGLDGLLSSGLSSSTNRDWQAAARNNGRPGSLSTEAGFDGACDPEGIDCI